jgi:hypothetical protein
MKGIISVKENKKEHSGFSDSVIGAQTTEAVERYGRAASEYIKGYKGNVVNGVLVKKGLKQVSDSRVHPDYIKQNLKQQAGFSAEIDYVNQKNAKNIINKKRTRFYRSNDIGRGNDPQIDILSVDEYGNPSNGAQMKFCGKFSTPAEISESSKQLVNKMTGKKWTKYRGTKVLVPKEQYEIAKKYAEDTAKKLSDKADQFRSKGNIDKANLLDEKATKYLQVSKDLENSGISSKEALFIRKHPRLATAKHVAKTAHRSGMENAKNAAVISAVISSAQNITSVFRGEKKTVDAAKDVVKDTGAGMVTAYAIGAGDTAIRGMLASNKTQVLQNLSKSNIPAMLATASVQVGKSLVRYSKGEIDSLELAQELGEKGTGMMAASFGVAVGTAFLPGIGTVVGGMVGYMASSTIYSSCMQVLREEKLSFERRKKINKIAMAAMDAMETQGEELLQLIDQFYENRYKVFSDSLMTIHSAGLDNSIERFTEGLNQIAIEMGKSLKFKNFNEFDHFMLDEKTTLDF